MPARRPRKATPARKAPEAASRRDLDAFLDKYTPEIAARARAALRTLRARLPGAQELVYDNYNALAIGFSPSDRVA